MKIRIYPQKNLVVDIINVRLADAKKDQESDQAELTKLTDGTIKVIRPGQDTALKHLMNQREQFIKQLENQLQLLESHAVTEVMTEIEL
jgi:hypothetical protein